MKRILSILCIACLLLGFLTSCRKESAASTKAVTTQGAVEHYPLSSLTVRPPTRSANTQLPSAYYDSKYSLLQLWEMADAVAWVSIGNWLSETEHGSYYDAVVVKCFKGSLPASIVIEQMGSSYTTYVNYPLFTYGNEFLIFLQNWDEMAFSVKGWYFADDKPSGGIIKPGIEYPTEPDHNDGTMPISEPEATGDLPDWGDEPIGTLPPWWDGVLKPYPVQTKPPSDTGDTPEPEPEPEPAAPYERCYQIIGSSALLDVAVGLDGDVYVLDRYFWVEPSWGFLAHDRPSAEVEADVRQLLQSRDAYCYRLFSERFLYRMSDLVDYLQNPPPETEED
ncbi:MAG: hypothetical protein IJW98_00185 [Clostridia bacterium]|nr:hypothetical protein [Clostridia bacterium]